MQNAIPIADSLHITAINADEMHHIVALARRIWPVAYKDILTPEQISNMLEKIYSPENLREEIQSGHRFWLAFYKNKPAGYLSSYRDGDIAWIKKIYVDPSLQGQGIGRRFIETAAASWPGARELRLLVNPHNRPAHRFYENAGFKKIAEVPVSMGDWNFDDFLYAKPL